MTTLLQFLFLSAVTISAATLEGKIPLCPGLTIVTAINQPEGDYESIKTIESIDAGAVRLKYSSERSVRDYPGGPARLRKTIVARTILIEDLRNARLYLQQFHDRAPAKVPGTTAIGTSAAVLRALKTKGEAEFGIFNPLTGDMSADPNKHPSVYDYQMVEPIRRVGMMTIPLTVNGAAVQLPAIQARGDFSGDKSEFYFLDDESNPLALKFHIGIGAVRTANSKGDRDTLQVVKIAYQCTGPAVNPGTFTESRLEQALAQTGKVDVYDIYFSFNSDAIREESEPTLKEIARILAKHPDWKLGVHGHTDSIASDAYNLELSKRRAAAVKDALVARYKIDGKRLVTGGFGESQPKDTNETLEGRARNRRVELVRLP